MNKLVLLIALAFSANAQYYQAVENYYLGASIPVLQTVEQECATQIGTFSAAFAAEVAAGESFDCENLLPADEYAFTKDSFKEFIKLVKDCIKQNEENLETALEAAADAVDPNLDTGVQVAIDAVGADAVGDDEMKNLEKLQKESKKALEDTIKSCVKSWPIYGEFFIVAMEGTFEQCAKDSSCPPAAR